MTSQSASKRDDPAQSKQFVKKAREIGADEEKSEFRCVDRSIGKEAARAAENEGVVGS